MVGRALAVLVACAVGAGCAGAGERAADRPNVLFLTVDTLRADRLGAYGAALPTSPAMDRLAARGTRFARAVATAPETEPATASLLTGHFQPGTRVRRNGQRLPDALRTLAERAAAAGWTTAAIVCNPLLTADYGFAQGFSHFVHLEREGRSTDDRAVDAAIAWLATAPGPWLLWLHLMDPHGPGNAAAPSLSAGFTYPPGLFASDSPLRVGRNVELGVIPGAQAMAGLDRLSQYVRRYDGDVRFTDDQIGRLLDVLEARGLAADTLIVFVADHGESLTEHGELLQHTWFVYETTVHVPLLLAWPGRVPAGRVVETRVSGADVLPTVLELAGIPVGAAAPLDGISLVPCLEGPCERPGPVWSLGGRDNHPLAVYDGEWKLVQTPGKVPPTPTEQTLPPEGFPTSERLELYRLDHDPQELRDVAADHPERVQAMRRQAIPIRRRLRTHGWEFYPGSGLPVDDGTSGD